MYAFALQSAESTLPIGITGGVVLLACLLVTLVWLLSLYR